MTLDREELRKSAASRSDGTIPAASATWPCEFCMKDFVTEGGFMRHHCAARERLELLKSPKGQAAYSFYSQWMKIKKFSVPAQDRFMSSKQFNYFIKFVEWAEKTAIPNPVNFVQLMVDHSVEPVLWCRDSTYSMYLEWYDNMYPPREQFMETLLALEKHAEEHGVPLDKVYEALGASTVAKLVRRRKLSPWLLTLSPNFLHWVQALPVHDREIVADAVNFGAFAAKINQNPELAKELRTACEFANV
jgi:hypothetical protein